MINLARKPQRYILLMVVFVGMALTSQSCSRDNPQSESEDPKEKFHIYLLIGQSNMAGVAPFKKEETGVIPRCYLLNTKNKWVPAKNPLNFYSTVAKRPHTHKLNPGYTFAKTMLDQDDSISIGLVVNARGSTKIEEWAKGTWCYNEALRRTAAARKKGTLKGILWHQGEANYTDPEYLDKLKSLITDIRADLDAPTLPFVAGQITNWAKIINDQIAKLPEAMPDTGFVSSEGLTTIDGSHFDSKSIKLLGRRYAKEMLKIHTHQKTE